MLLFVLLLLVLLVLPLRHYYPIHRTRRHDGREHRRTCNFAKVGSVRTMNCDHSIIAVVLQGYKMHAEDGTNDVHVIL